jgi:hypothetical protein
MSKSVTFEFEGWQEFQELCDQIEEDYGPDDQRKILRTAVRNSLRPVLEMAQSLVPKDTGALAASLQIEARKPTAKDKRSKYAVPTEIIIGRVTTAPGSKLAKKRFHNLHNTKSNIKQVGIESDGRAMFMEFGFHDKNGVYHAPHPYLRPAMERMSPQVLQIIGGELGKALESYKSKHNK